MFKLLFTCLTIATFALNPVCKIGVSLDKASMNTNENKIYEPVMSYKDILYDMYISEEPYVRENISFDEFVINYYKERNEIIPVDNYVPCERNGVIEIISPDADYILGTSNPTTTPSSMFERAPSYSGYSYPALLPGDIILETTTLNGIGHLAYLYDTAKQSGYGTYYQTIEAVAGGVQFGFLDNTRILSYGVCIYRVYRAYELGVVANCQTFMENQIGKNYSIDFTCTHISPSRNAWYCSELIFAAYLNNGMDILYNTNYNPANFDYNNIPFIPNIMEHRFFGGKILDYTPLYLSASIDRYSSSKWYITVYNPNSYTIDLEYNSKMCFYNHGINWTNLSNIQYVSLDSHCSYQAVISENWFADSVTFSFYKIGHRYVTCGKNLSKTNLTMTVNNKTI